MNNLGEALKYVKTVKKKKNNYKKHTEVNGLNRDIQLYVVSVTVEKKHHVYK